MMLNPTLDKIRTCKWSKPMCLDDLTPAYLCLHPSVIRLREMGADVQFCGGDVDSCGGYEEMGKAAPSIEKREKISEQWVRTEKTRRDRGRHDAPVFNWLLFLIVIFFGSASVSVAVSMIQKWLMP